MNAELKRVHSPDIYNLKSYQPECSDSFCFLLQAMIGPAGEDGEESFDIEVCTPKWIESHLEINDGLIGVHYLIVREYSYKKSFTLLRSFCWAVRGRAGVR